MACSFESSSGAPGRTINLSELVSYAVGPPVGAEGHDVQEEQDIKDGHTTTPPEEEAPGRQLEEEYLPGLQQSSKT